MDVNDFKFLPVGRMDRVIFVNEGSATINGGGAVDIDTSSIGEPMLPHASVSFDGVNWVSEESPSYPEGSTSTDLSVSATSYATMTRLQISTPNRNGTVHYRLLGVKNGS